MNKTNKKLILPEECGRLSVNACTTQKIKGKCKIKRGFLGLNSKCVANENYESDKYLFEKGFVNFARIDENNLDEELKNRDLLCKQLSTLEGGACDSLQGRALGCSIKRTLYGKKTCGLSKEITNFFYRKRKDCVAKDCEVKRKKYSSLCEEHDNEFKELLQEYKSLYQSIKFKNTNINENIYLLDDVYDYIQEIFGKYLLEKPNIRDGIEKMKMDIEFKINKNQCQAYNISKCNTKNVNQRCLKKGYETDIGTFCATHKECYKKRIVFYKKVRDNIDRLCAEEKCNAQLDKIKELYNMIRFTTEGEAFRKKYEILETIEIIEEYSRL